MRNAPEMAWRLNCVGNMLSIGSAYRGERIEGDDLVSDITLTPRERVLIHNEFMVRFVCESARGSDVERPETG